MSDCRAITAETLTNALKEEAARLGFDLCGASPAVPPDGLEGYRRWVESGFAGEMGYLGEHCEARGDLNRVLDGVRSVVMLAMNYHTTEPAETGPGQGRVSRYAWGEDYHDVVHGRLKQLKAFHLGLTPQAGVRGVVDTAPLLEREFAVRAGLGWIGKNTMLIHPQLGSWIFLAALLTTEELVYDAPMDAGKCGGCQACLDACPTGALVAPYTLDARRCLSYLTIEHRGEIPSERWGAMDDRVFGCDACQEACPHNRRTPATDEAAFKPCSERNPLPLAALFSLSDAEFRLLFRHSPIYRAKRAGMLRNAATVLGNHPSAQAVAALRRGAEDSEPLVCAACRAALRRMDTAGKTPVAGQDSRLADK